MLLHKVKMEVHMTIKNKYEIKNMKYKNSLVIK